MKSFFSPDSSSFTINDESVWAMFIAKHNLAFLSSDHANKLFREMFPDSEISKKFYHKKAVSSLSNSFSILMDGSNDKADKSCIILVRVLDSTLGEVKTRFLDMPVVNVGNASEL